MEVKPGYKQTEVGVIPEEWDVKTISQLAPLQRGFDLPTRDIKSGRYPVVYSNGVDRFHEAAMVKGPGVVTGRSGTLGKVHYVETDYWPHNTSLWVTRFHDNDPKFIYYLFEALHFERFAAGSGVPTLNRNDAHSHRIAVPTDRDEQRAIATALSDVDALLGALDRLIAKKRDLKQAAMQQLLTGQTRLPGFQGEWELKRVSEVCWFQEGPGVRNTQFTSAGVKLLNGTNIFRGRINLDTTERFISKNEAYGAYAHFLADSGDIVIACSGISVEKFHEKVAIVSPAHLPVCMNTSTMRFKPRQEHLIRDYFCHFLMGDSFKRQIAPQATGSAQLNFGPSHVEKVELPLPPLPEQTAIAEVLTDMDAELAALDQRREKTHALKQAMMQELLTGRIRLV